jgi:hypothetical protein
MSARSAVKKGRGRSWVAGIVLVIASLILPTAIVGHWATVQINNGNQFVDSLAPLSANPEVQALIVKQLSTAIDNQIHVDKMTENLVDGLGTALRLPDAAKKALDLLSAPISSGVEGLISDTVAKIVASPAFQTAWKDTLTLTHDQLIAVLANKPNTAVQISSDGTLSISLKPLMAAVKTQLVEAHVPFAQAIPEVNTTIAIAKIPQLAAARIAYQVGVGVGAWLPWIVAALFGAAILAARRRWRMVMITGIAVFVMTGIVGAGLSAGKIVLSATLNADIAQVAAVVYDSVIAYAVTVVAGLLVLGLLLALTGALLGLDSTQKIRRWFATRFASARTSMNKFGMDTGKFGAGLWRNRIAVRTVLVVLGVLLVGLMQPMNPASVLATAVLLVGLLVGVEILQRPVVPAAKKSPARTKK